MTSFDRFGVTERMIRDTLAAALSRGGDFADVFFEHSIGSDLGLEDGAVNRAYASVSLGVVTNSMLAVLAIMAAMRLLWLPARA